MTTDSPPKGRRPGGALEALTYHTLGDQIKDQLLTRIITGDLAPGDEIVETKVARDLGISQGPVREALRDLATLGLVELRPYRSALVREPTPEEYREAILVRASLERLAAQEAASAISEADLDRLRRLIDEMRDLAIDGDVHELALKNTEFHATIVRAADNRTLERHWLLLQPFARTYITTATRGPTDPDRTVKRHRDLLTALESHDADLAAEAMWAHASSVVDVFTDQTEK